MDKRVDSYITKAADFAKPILDHLRKQVHIVCPQVEESIKWSFPHFSYKGEILCSMAAFKHHCAFVFWKASLMKDKTLMENAKRESAMGHLGKIKSLKDLPSAKKLQAYIKEAMKLIEAGVKVQKVKPVKTVLKIPGYFLSALKRNKQAQKTFEAFSYSNKKDYLQWITEAKTEVTREKRIETALEWMAEGKPRNWKYMKL